MRKYLVLALIVGVHAALVLGATVVPLIGRIVRNPGVLSMAGIGIAVVFGLTILHTRYQGGHRVTHARDRDR